MFTQSSGSFVDPDNGNSYDGRYADVAFEKIVIRDYTASLGNVIYARTYDDNDNLIEAIENTCLHDKVGYEGLRHELENNYNSQGIVDQVFNEYRIKKGHSGSDGYHRISTSRREEYPNVLVKSEHYMDGITTITRNKSFDFYTGQPTVVVVSNNVGLKYSMQTTPAYTVYPEMGITVNNPNNKHMLTQSAQSWVIDVSDGSDAAASVVSANIQTWDDGWSVREYNSTNNVYINDNSYALENVWRKHKTYSWDNEVVDNGTVDFAGTIMDFDFSSPSASQHPQWKLLSEVTKYDPYSHPLEEKNTSERYATVKYGYGNSRLIASASNSEYGDLAYSGAEDPFITSGGKTRYGGEIVGTSSTSVKAHTGESSFEFSDGLFQPIYRVKGSDMSKNRAYRASAWFHHNDFNDGVSRLYYRIIKTNGSYKDLQETPLKLTDFNSRGWFLVNLDIDNVALADNEIVEVGVIAKGTVYVDDFRFHPMDAGVSSFVYDNDTGDLTYVLNNDNIYTRYTYDHAGRLEAVYQETAEGEKLVSSSKMNYAN